jgi:hypothetical protein
VQHCNESNFTVKDSTEQTPPTENTADDGNENGNSEHIPTDNDEYKRGEEDENNEDE